MKILIGVSHPKHIHIFRNLVRILRKKGHEVLVISNEKDIMEHLLKQFSLPYISIGKTPSTIPAKILNLVFWEYRTLNLALHFKPDIFIGRSLPHFAHISCLLCKPFIIMEDTEHAVVVQRISFPFADAIVTPSCYRVNVGPKQVCFDSYYELAYLHPKYFIPNSEVLNQIGLTDKDVFIILRFVALNALHDVGHKGINHDMKLHIVKELEKYGRVFITSEAPLPEIFEPYKIKIPPEKMHDLLYYATLFFGESATMATECAVLGTPAIYLDFTGRGYTDEVEQKYGLVYNFNNDEVGQEKALEKAIELISNNNLKEECALKRAKLLDDKIDVTEFMLNIIETYSK
ncbi:hypothetical protein MSSAC_3432 [Methanosarcina siciliae C2J]|uniref:DUF354 domain-containing protein n=1 Tax=Methanosarcina siciliae C2J TaxID=1434118 RepID=A0A0E3PT05_9EURY|nr:DUF354 domain-containing protein [Methanosarcina siciliae]AKB38022.1 hypothetical protein MSSAC_3432 [Methanosarcina siciliae C2J]